MKTSQITVYRLNRANKSEQTLFCATGLVGGVSLLLAACLTRNLGGHFFCALPGLAFLAVGLLLLLRRRCVMDWTKRSVSEGRDCPEASEFGQRLSAEFGFKVVEKDGLGDRRFNPLSI